MRRRKKNQPMPVVNDVVFATRVRRIYPRIPTEAEVREFSASKDANRRQKLIDQLLEDERFADRWTTFYSDMLRLRSQTAGGAALIAYVHQAVKAGMPYDEMCRRLIATNGKAGKIPEAGFILGDDADPLAMASVTSQVFLGVRIGCAQCHDHPFDVWDGRDFYDMAAFFGKTRRFESQLTKVVYATETNQTSILWPPERAAPAEERKPIDARFPFGLRKVKETPAYVKRLARPARQNSPPSPSRLPTRARPLTICSKARQRRWRRRRLASWLRNRLKLKPKKTSAKLTFRKVCTSPASSARSWPSRSPIL